MLDDYSTLPKTKKQARTLGVRHYFTGRPCPRGHICPKYASNGTCAKCLRGWKSEYDADPEHRECARANARSWYAANPERAKRNSRAWRESNPDRVTENQRAYNAANKERKAEYNRAWNQSSHGKARQLGHIAARRAAKKNAAILRTPEELGAIRLVYEEAVNLMTDTGVQHHVDHQVPLRAKLRGVDLRCPENPKGYVACGLHLRQNLRAIPGEENLRKQHYVTEADLAQIDAQIFAELVAKGLARPR